MTDKLIINSHNLQDEFGLFLKWRKLSAPEPKTNYIEIAGADGMVDATEANGEVFYNMRTLTLDCVYIGNEDCPTWESALNKVLNMFHGKDCQIMFANSPESYFMGRVSVSEYSAKEHSLVMSALVHPYAFASTETVVNSSGSSGSTKSVTLENAGSKTITPTVVATASVQLQWGTYQKSISAGTHVIAGLEIPANDSIDVDITYSGSGTVKFKWRAMSL